MLRQLSQQLVLLHNNLLDGFLAEVTVDIPLENVSSQLLCMVLDGFVDFFDLLVEEEVRSVCHFVCLFIYSLGQEGHDVNFWSCLNFYYKIVDFLLRFVCHNGHVDEVRISWRQQLPYSCVYHRKLEFFAFKCLNSSNIYIFHIFVEVYCLFALTVL